MHLFTLRKKSMPLARGISCLLLTALLLQVAPFAFHQPELAAGAADGGAKRYFKPLQVCGDLQVPGSLLADIPWLSTSHLSSLFTPCFSASRRKYSSGTSSVCAACVASASG